MKGCCRKTHVAAARVLICNILLAALPPMMGLRPDYEYIEYIVCSVSEGFRHPESCRCAMRSTSYPRKYKLHKQCSDLAEASQTPCSLSAASNDHVRTCQAPVNHSATKALQSCEGSELDSTSPGAGTGYVVLKTSEGKPAIKARLVST